MVGKITDQLLREVPNNALASSQMDLNAKSPKEINLSFLLSFGLFTFYLTGHLLLNVWPLKQEGDN